MRAVPPWLREARGLVRLAAGLVRGSAGRALRRFDPERPQSWEFRGLSQNREDGILDHLSRQIQDPGRFVVEIGAGFGIDGNIAWPLVVGRCGGLLVEADAARLEVARILLRRVTTAVRFHRLEVSAENAPELLALLPDVRPDVLSIDIDGIDLHVTRALLAAGLRPRILIVEYNSAFGPERPLSVPYRPGFDFRGAHPSGLYYGASIAGWCRVLAGHGYRFVTVESAGVNAVFVDPGAFPAAGLGRLAGCNFRENRFQLRHFGCGHVGQMEKIAGLELEMVD